MLDALDLAGSRDAALVRFARSVSGTEVLRAALDSQSRADKAAAAVRHCPPSPWPPR
jgi:hypothetical protein